MCGIIDTKAVTVVKVKVKVYFVARLRFVKVCLLSSFKWPGFLHLGAILYTCVRTQATGGKLVACDCTIWPPYIGHSWSTWELLNTLFTSINCSTLSLGPQLK